MPRKLTHSVLLASLCSTLVLESAKADSLNIDIGGFVRADYATGDRFPEAEGEDQLGISKAALALSAKGDNVEAVLVFGTELMTVDSGSDDGNVDLKDAFIVLNKAFDSDVTLKFGAQPLLFGLKPNGYPGDRSLQGSIEYGAAGAVAVSNQAGPSAIAHIPVNKNFTVEAGLFDRSTPGNITDTEGSSLTNNFFVQVRLNEFDGFYGVAGIESVYLGSTRDNSNIIDIGFGYKFGQFDASIEYISLEADITGTADDETYLVGEFTYNHTEATQVYFDYSSAAELDVTALRMGVHQRYREFLTLSAEFSQESSDNEALEASSLDFRLEMKF